MRHLFAGLPRTLLVLAAVGGLAVPAAVAAQEGWQESGPRIQTAGHTYAVESPTFATPPGHHFRVVFEIDAADNEGAEINPDLVTVARFLNMHAREGVPDEQVQAAAVFHAGAWPALLTDEAYAARHGGTPNPSRALVRELLDAGVPLVLCGQTAVLRGVSQADLVPGAQIALSAMTALNVFFTQGYHLNPW